MDIRRYQPGEETEIWALYFNTTHQVVAQQYTAEQVHKWAPVNADMIAWTKKLAQTKPLVAIENDQIIGFAELEADGHIDNFYCHHRWQRRGVGSALLEAVEAEAKRTGIASLFAEVSTTGVAFFQAKGFVIVEERANVVCRSPARQFIMQKREGVA